MQPTEKQLQYETLLPKLQKDVYDKLVQIDLEKYEQLKRLSRFMQRYQKEVDRETS